MAKSLITAVAASLLLVSGAASAGVGGGGCSYGSHKLKMTKAEPAASSASTAQTQEPVRELTDLVAANEPGTKADSKQ